MTQEPIGRQKSTFQTVFDGIVKARWWLLALSVVILASSYFDVFPTLPELNLWQGVTKSVILGFVLGTLFLYVPTVKVFKLFYNPKIHWLIELDSANENKPFSLYKIGSLKFENMTIEGKKLFQFTTADGNNAYIVNKYDEEENKALNNWMGEVNERELMQSLEKIEEHRLRNLRWARIGRKLYSNFEKIITEIEATFWKQKTDQVTKTSGVVTKEIKQTIFESIEEIQELESDKDKIQEEIASEEDQNQEQGEKEEQDSGKEQGQE